MIDMFEDANNDRTYVKETSKIFEQDERGVNDSPALSSGANKQPTTGS